MTVYRRGA